MTPPDREQLLDELARCFMRAAVDELLEDPKIENAAESSQEQRRREGSNDANDNRTAATHAS